MSECYETRALAKALLDAAVEARQAYDLGRAAELFQNSIAVLPTVEGFLGAARLHGFLGRFTEAIDNCHRAIELDSSQGRPYNDIGFYLIEAGRNDEAIAWLQKALHAPSYDMRADSYLSLGRIYTVRGELRRGLACFRTCLTLDPSCQSAKTALRSLLRQFN